MGLKQFAATVVVLSAVLSSSFGALQPERNYRLPNTTTPSSYAVHLATKLDKDNFVFNGNVSIVVTANENTANIVLHSTGADIKKIEVRPINSQYPVGVLKFEQDNETDFLTISLQQLLKKGASYNLDIAYTSELRKDKLGFYRSSYLNDNGDQVWLAATQFAPTHARHAFPCYDEPRYKTKFTISIRHPNTLQAISNTPLIRQFRYPEDNTLTTFFETTPVLPTYLVGVVISNFRQNTVIKKDFRQEFYTRPNIAVSSTKFSEDFSSNAFERLMQYFFSVDMRKETRVIKEVALPTFHFSGMENFGIVTYKESRVLYDQRISEEWQKLDIMSLMGHEMAHYWFGDLVTMKWWSNVWLKEGFSTLYSYYVQDMLYPNWRSMEAYQANVQHLALSIDAESTTHPMTTYPETQRAIRENYDKIAYEKSSAVLQMIDHAMGRDLFKKAVDSYLKKNAWSSVDEQSLYSAIDEVSVGQKWNFSRSLRSWTSQAGYPVVDVVADPVKKTLLLTQRRFLANGDKAKTNNALWEIPFNYVTEKTSPVASRSTLPDMWLDTRSKTVPAAKWDGKGWVLANVLQTGYYRVNYDANNWQALKRALVTAHNAIDVHHRAQLLDDAFSLAEGSYLKNYTFPLELSLYLTQERDFSPWNAFSVHVDRLARRLEGRDSFEALETVVQHIVQCSFQTFGPRPKQPIIPTESATRRIIAGLAQRFDKGRYDANMDLNFRQVKFCSALKSDNPQAVYANLVEVLQTSVDSVLRNEVLSTIGCARDENILNAALLRTLQENSDFKFVDNERTALLSGVFKKSLAGRKIALNFLRRNWKRIAAVYGDSALDTVVKDWSLYVNTQELVELFNEVLSEVKVSEQAEDKARENLVATMDWIVRAEPDFSRFMRGLKLSCRMF